MSVSPRTDENDMALAPAPRHRHGRFISEYLRSCGRWLDLDAVLDQGLSGSADDVGGAPLVLMAGA